MLLRMPNPPAHFDRRVVERAVRIHLARFAPIIDRVGLSFQEPAGRERSEACRLRVRLRDGARLESVGEGESWRDAAAAAASRLRRHIERRNGWA